MTYARAGVSISTGDDFVRKIRKQVRSTFSPGVLRDIGAFGAFYDARFKGYRSPVLVSSVDGVGTKLMVAKLAGRHDTVGQDLVNHCVNDILVCGAKPLYFMDYFATGRLRVDVAAEVIGGFVKACRENGCALIGGETAEMPGMYGAGDYDLAGTIVGVVEKRRIIDGRKVRKGDVMIGLPSTGLHTNGYSLARAVLLKRHTVRHRLDDLGMTIGDALLRIHRSYLPVVTRLLERHTVHAMAHITGGGIEGNTMRVVPKGRALAIDWESWERPPLFRVIQEMGNVPEADMRRTFNLGIGLVLLVPPREAPDVLARLRRRGEEAAVIGRVV